jgi:hypothetical protein
MGQPALIKKFCKQYRRTFGRLPLKSFKAGSQPSSQERAQRKAILAQLAALMSRASTDPPGPQPSVVQALPLGWALRSLLQSTGPDREQRKAAAVGILQALTANSSFRTFAAEAPVYDIAVRMQADAGFSAEMIGDMLEKR